MVIKLDYALVATAYNKEVRIYIANSKNAVESARQIHGTWPTATAALGRLLTVTALFGLMMDNLSVSTKIEGNGPIKKMVAEADNNGNVKGDIINPEVYLTYNNGDKKGKLAVGKAVGEGTLTVVKDLGLKDYFTSSVNLKTGEIAEDFTYYFAVSEQTPSSVGLGVLVNTDEKVLEAGGFILQLMPFASEETIITLEKIISNLKPFTTLLEEGKNIEDILNILSNNTAVIHDKKYIRYYCGCSRERYLNSIKSLDKDTLKDFSDDENGIEVVCHFCKKKYLFNQDEIKQIYQNRKWLLGQSKRMVIKFK